MANKYHRQGFKVGKIVKTIENIYKLDKTGKKAHDHNTPITRT